MATIPRKRSKFPCHKCGYEKPMSEECPQCAKAERESADKKDHKEFYSQFKGMSLEDKIDWILEWIRLHRNSFHGHSSFDIQRMVDSGPTCF
jgi:hypothetical protein